MKRADVVAGGDYLTTKGEHVRVHALDPGWAVVDGEWVAARGKGRRYVPGKAGEAGSWKEYISNYAIRAEVCDVEDWPVAKTVLHPRVLVRPWTHVDAVLAAKTKTAEALADTWARRLRSRGLSSVQVSPDCTTVTVALASLARALSIEEKP